MTRLSCAVEHPRSMCGLPGRRRRRPGRAWSSRDRRM